MAEALYTRAILKLAMTLTPDDHLDAYDGQADMRSFVCGSEMNVQIALDDNQTVTQFAIQAKACAMGQASAAILKKYAVGLTASQARSHLDALSAYLNGDDELAGDWPELAELKAAKDYPARHSAILLPYRTLMMAFEDIQKQKPA